MRIKEAKKDRKTFDNLIKLKKIKKIRKGIERKKERKQKEGDKNPKIKKSKIWTVRQPNPFTIFPLQKLILKEN